MCTIEQAEKFVQSIPCDVVAYSFRKILSFCTPQELLQLAANCVSINPASSLEEYLHILKLITFGSDLEFSKEIYEQKTYQYNINIFLHILELQQQYAFFFTICNIAEYKHKIALATRKIPLDHPELCVEPRGRKRVRNLAP